MNALFDGKTSDSAANGERLARGLGWFGIATGLASILMPRKFAQIMGVANRPTRSRIIGVREVASGIGILRGRRPGQWLLVRIAGDAVDLALFGAEYRRNDSTRKRILQAALALTAVMMLDVVAVRRHHA